jgi:hypothetical protein
MCFFYLINSLLELKTFIIMANFEIKFFCESQIEEAWIKCGIYKDDFFKNSIRIELNDPFRNDRTSSIIYLDKSTAIKFAKTLRTEINKITESEVNNG